MPFLFVKEDVRWKATLSSLDSRVKNCLILCLKIDSEVTNHIFLSSLLTVVSLTAVFWMSQESIGGALCDIQKTAARETMLTVTFAH